jgi:hypothetical protein
MAYVNKKGDKTMGSAGRREIGIEIEGVTYTVRELDLHAYGLIENFLKTKRAKLYRESSVGMDPGTVNEMVMKIIKTDISAEELGAEATSIDCVVYTAYLSMKHNPGITRENFGEIVSMDDINRIGDIIDSMGEDDDVNPPEAVAENP